MILKSILTEIYKKRKLIEHQIKDKADKTATRCGYVYLS